MKEDLIEQVKKMLSLPEDDRTGNLSMDQAMPVLRKLAGDVQVGQQAIGLVLWHLDPSPAELAKIAAELNFAVGTLKSWVTTYSRLRKDAYLAVIGFSMQQQLARVQNEADRRDIWYSRPPGEWTLEALTTAVNLHMESIGASVMPKTKKAGAKAKFDSRQVKVNLELTEDVVIVRLAVSEGVELDLEDAVVEKVSKGQYQVKFGW